MKKKKTRREEIVCVRLSNSPLSLTVLYEIVRRYDRMSRAISRVEQLKKTRTREQQSEVSFESDVLSRFQATVRFNRNLN